MTTTRSLRPGVAVLVAASLMAALAAASQIGARPARPARKRGRLATSSPTSRRGGAVLGNPAAPVTLVDYADL